jgi:hypothetical protein
MSDCVYEQKILLVCETRTKNSFEVCKGTNLDATPPPRL